MTKLVAQLLCFLAVALVALPAVAYTPPPMTAHVTDTAGKLTEAERLDLDRKLEDYRLRTTNQVAVFIPATLEGDSIDDVAFTTFRTWKLGEAHKDNGVLVVIAPVERRARIEVGRALEGPLPDLQANDIIRQKIRPNLTPGSENYYAAAQAATDAIIATLDAGGVTPTPAAPRGGGGAVALIMLLLVFLVPIILFITIIRALTRAFTSHGPYANRGWVSGSTWSNDSSWSSSDSGWSGGDSSGWSGGGDSGFTGGGGDTGGGGSSDSF